MALFSTLNDLKDAIRHETEKQRNAKLDGAFPRIIAGAEQRMFYGSEAPYKSPALRLRCMETSTSLTLSSGSVAMPAGFLQAKRLYWAGEPKTWPTYEPAHTFFTNRFTDATGSPVRYTVDDETLYVSPPVSGAITLYYYALPDALEDEADTNAMLTAYPMIYFDAALIETYRFLRNGEMVQDAYASYMSRVGGLAAAENRAKRGDATPLAPRIPHARVIS